MSTKYQVPNESIMKRFKKIFFVLVILTACLYVLVCAGAYFFQESLIFHPKKLDPSFVFKDSCTEKYFYTESGDTLHGLLFKSDSSKGLVFYLHGNAGAVDTWGKAHEAYTGL